MHFFDILYLKCYAECVYLHILVLMYSFSFVMIVQLFSLSNEKTNKEKTT